MKWLRIFVLWIGLSALLHLAWELIQLPLYTIYHQAGLPEIAFAVAHCTAGDLLISAATYVVAAVGARNGGWPVERAGLGLAFAIPAGMIYTAFSEWLNVSVRGSWEYAPSMPQVFGIGLSPLFQWLVVPAVTLLVLRAVPRARRRA